MEDKINEIDNRLKNLENLHAWGFLVLGGALLIYLAIRKSGS